VPPKAPRPCIYERTRPETYAFCPPKHFFAHPGDLAYAKKVIDAPKSTPTMHLRAFLPTKMRPARQMQTQMPRRDQRMATAQRKSGSLEGVQHTDADKGYGSTFFFARYGYL
jgi:hypothetical protein